ncbi:MAG TPA: hypothetical protein VHV77_12250 [Pirellulales bacterium]|nr:hypothetical protein [Pirellulales bacterium]
MIEAGHEPLRIVGERAKKLGLAFFPSYRILVNEQGEKSARRCVLRLGFDGLDRKDNVRIVLNGKTVHHGPVSDLLVPVTAHADPTLKNPRVPSAYFQCDIDDVSMLRTGENAISVEVAPRSAGASVEVIDVQIGVIDR